LRNILQNGTIVLKFFLHISKEEQRTLRRLEEKNTIGSSQWGDLKERERWDDYMQYYEA
jgi:polyphosphate kinase 2 (PPK2 family)